MIPSDLCRHSFAGGLLWESCTVALLAVLFPLEEQGEQGQFSGIRSSSTAGIHSHSCRSRHYSTYTGPAGLPAPSAAPGTTRGEQRPLAAIRMTRERLLRQTKNPFSNKKNPSFPHHAVVLPPLWQHQFTFIPFAELFFSYCSIRYDCSEFPRVILRKYLFLHWEYVLTVAVVF